MIIRSHNENVVAFFLIERMMKLGINTISTWFGLLMVLVVFSGVVAFTFTNFMEDRLFGSRRTSFIIILLAYGIYRSIRLYQVFKHAQHEE